ncbi:MAG: hypothetical protein HKN96_03880, partial [Flavobacteriaceae bacterium]|nr:hypothetical protein [Flavobacteriaceae bacterium]
LFEITVRDWGTSQPASEAIGAYIYRTSGLKQGSGWRMTPGDWTHFTVTVSHSGGNTDFKVLRNGFGSGLGTVTTTTNTNSKPFLIGIDESNSYNAFTGAIDELRIFNKVLTDEQIRRMLYQEIKNEGGKVRGTIIDKDIHDDATGDDIDWTELITYYPMSNVNYGKLPDASSYGNDAVLYNITTFQEETAPMPYETVADGAWTDEATWLHGDIWDIESLDTDFGASNQNPEPWSIVKIHHNVTTNTDRRGLGLFIDENKTLSTIGDVSITNNWYLQLDGTIDLVDDSQLIQSEFSDLTTSATGKILRRQEGNSDVYFYNYWSSPVGTMGANSLTDNNAASNNANNSPFNLSMLKDGSGSSFQFTSAFDEAGKISDRWLYNFQNGLTYWDWVTINPSSDITPGFGYSQKGTGNTGLTQQYIFEGKPNNGTILIAADDVDGDDTGVGESIQDISLTTTLIGNPYPSALDAEEFIRDNIDFDNGGANPIIQGTILLWEQWAGNSHWLAEYEGGYGYINLTETARAYQHPDIAISDPTNTDNRGIKTPTKFLPVGQGFFVEVVNDGNIEFNNSQRIFKTEDLGDSVFFRGEQAQNENGSAETSANRADEYEDPMQTIKLELTISNGATRRFVLGFSDHTTDQYDHGYDGGLISQKPDNDMASLINGNPYVIQAFSAMTPEKEIDLYFNSSGDMNYVLDIVELKNIDEGQDIFIRDNRQNLIWNLSSD